MQPMQPYKDEKTISAFNNMLERLKRRLNTANDKIIQKTGQWKSQNTIERRKKQNEKTEESIKKYVESVQHVLFVEFQGEREQSRGNLEEMVAESLPTA